MITLAGRYRGCLLGGAVGDALGADVEFLSLEEIRRRHGRAGVSGYVPAYGRLGAITDDTQMTLFTAEGLLRDRRLPPGERDPTAAIWRAYRRWLRTQDGGYASPAGESDGWLSSQAFLYAERMISAVVRRADLRAAVAVALAALRRVPVPSESAATCQAPASAPAPSKATCLRTLKDVTSSPKSPTTCAPFSPAASPSDAERYPSR